MKECVGKWICIERPLSDAKRPYSAFERSSFFLRQVCADTDRRKNLLTDREIIPCRACGIGTKEKDANVITYIHVNNRVKWVSRTYSTYI